MYLSVMEDFKIGDRVTTGRGISGVVQTVGVHFATIKVDYDNGYITAEIRVFELADLEKLD